MSYIYGLVLPLAWFLGGMLVVEVFGGLEMDFWVWFILLLPLLAHGLFHIYDLIATNMVDIKKSNAFNKRMYRHH
ncbi:MAG: hypothetical protein HQL69_08820 [Magnetococcales bacterium]|nr:hypothetical protein [Magnetococcales bacterium]